MLREDIQEKTECQSDFQRQFSTQYFFLVFWRCSSWTFLKVWAGEILHQFKKIVTVIPEEDNKRTEKHQNQSYFVHEMNRSLVAVVSWYTIKLIWLNISLVVKTTKQKIKPTLTGKVEKQGTPAVATLHNKPINNKLNLHYLAVLFHHVLQKKKEPYNISAKYFLLPLTHQVHVLR